MSKKHDIVMVHYHGPYSKEKKITCKLSILYLNIYIITIVQNKFNKMFKYSERMELIWHYNGAC